MIAGIDHHVKYCKLVGVYLIIYEGKGLKGQTWIILSLVAAIGYRNSMAELSEEKEIKEIFGHTS